MFALVWVRGLYTPISHSAKSQVKWIILVLNCDPPKWERSDCWLMGVLGRRCLHNSQRKQKISDDSTHRSHPNWKLNSKASSSPKGLINIIRQQLNWVVFMIISLISPQTRCFLQQSKAKAPATAPTQPRAAHSSSYFWYCPHVAAKCYNM